MKVAVRRSDLMSQLPKELQYLLIASVDQLPDRFEFDVLPVSEFQKKDSIRDGLPKKHKKIKSILTPVEWEFFAEMMTKEDGATQINLGKYLHVGRGSIDNTISVHIKDIRDKFKKNSIPFEIEGIRKSRFAAGTYRLKPL